MKASIVANDLRAMLQERWIPLRTRQGRVARFQASCFEKCEAGCEELLAYPLVRVARKPELQPRGTNTTCVECKPGTSAALVQKQGSEAVAVCHCEQKWIESSRWTHTKMRKSNSHFCVRPLR